MSAPPLTLTCPEGGVARAVVTCTSSDGAALHALSFEVSRAWVDLLIGVVSGEGDITLSHFSSRKLRCEPGVHVLQFTPGAATFYITAQRDREGLTAITDMDFAGQAGDLVLATPYEFDDLGSIRSGQSRDVRWMWHARHEPRALVRHANSSWGLIRWRADDGPFLAPGDETITLTPSATRGNGIAIASSEDAFEGDHINALFQLVHTGQSKTAAISGADLWTDWIRVSGVEAERVFNLTISGTFVATVTLQRSVGSDTNPTDVVTYAVGTHQVDDGLDNSAIYYRAGVKTAQYTSGTVNVSLVYAAGETIGVARVVSVVDEQNATIDILAPFGAAVATRYWAEGAWSALRGFPAAGDLFDGRLWLGNVLDVWASAPDNFASFLSGAEDNEGIARSIAVGDGSPIVWMKGAFRLQLGTDSGAADIDAVRVGESSALQVRSSTFDEPITPTNMTLRDVSAKIVFIDASLKKLLRLSFDVDTQTFFPEDLSRLNEDIAGDGFVDLAHQARFRPRLWAPRVDGQIVCLTLAEAEAVVGFSRVKLGDGSLRAAEIAENGWDDERAACAESVAASPGVRVGETDQDFVHLVVERTLGGARVRCHERIEAERIAAEMACFVECGLRYEGVATRYLSGLDHLFGETVTVWGDSSNRGELEVALLADIAPGEGFDDGEIGVDLGEGNEVESAWVGLTMRTRYMSGKLPYGAQAGSAVGEKKSADHITMLFYETALEGVKVGVADGNDPEGEAVWFAEERLYRVPDLVPALASMDAAPGLYTGELKLPLQWGNMLDPRIVIEIDGAGPAAVLGYVVNMVTNESP